MAKLGSMAARCGRHKTRGANVRHIQRFESHPRGAAFQKPQRKPAPKVTDARWARNPVDAFIKSALDAKGLVPAAEADRAMLIRRAYLDLIGLTPHLQRDLGLTDGQSGLKHL